MSHYHFIREATNSLTGTHWISIDYDPWVPVCEKCYYCVSNNLPPLTNTCWDCADVAYKEGNFKIKNKSKSRRGGKKGFTEL